MKKVFLILSLMLILITGSNVTAFADAMTYDMEEAGYYVYVATPDGGLNMRHGPGTDYAKVMDERIPDGVRLYIGYTSGNWGYTSYNGNDGWVALRQTTTTPPESEPAQTPSEAQPPVEEKELQHIEEAAPTETEETEEKLAEKSSDEKIAEAQTDNSEDAEIVKTAMVGQIVLIAVLVVFVIIIAVLVVIIINMKSKRQ